MHRDSRQSARASRRSHRCRGGDAGDRRVTRQAARPVVKDPTRPRGSAPKPSTAPAKAVKSGAVKGTGEEKTVPKPSSGDKEEAVGYTDHFTNIMGESFAIYMFVRQLIDVFLETGPKLHPERLMRVAMVLYLGYRSKGKGIIQTLMSLKKGKASMAGALGTALFVKSHEALTYVTMQYRQQRLGLA